PTLPRGTLFFSYQCLASSCLIFFFLIIRRPPRSTLFPSRRSSDLARCLTWAGRATRSPAACRTTSGWLTSCRGSSRHAFDSQNLDRKSTRLNSSHLGISYAVFCLKKKKKENTTHTK